MDEEVEAFLKEWLHEVRSNQFSKSSLSNPEVIEAIYTLIEEWRSNKDLTSTLCLQFFGFYRSGDLNLKVFTLQFIPSLIYAYLNGIAQGDRKDVGCIQTLLLAIYNLEVGEEAQKLKTLSFRIPNLAQPSVYHGPQGLAPSALTESALKRLDPANRITVKFGPYPHLQSFNAENRLPAIAALLQIYLEHLTMYSSNSLAETCLAFTRLVTQGYTNQTEKCVRIPLSSQILVVVLRIIYSLIPLNIAWGSKLHISPPLNRSTPADDSAAPPVDERFEDGDLGTRAEQALTAVQNRVEVELLPAPLLVSSAIRDSSSLSIKGDGNSSQLFSTSTAGSRAQWKSMITNASFRTKKLPDDITVANYGESEVSVAVPSTSAPSSTGVSQPTAPAPTSVRETLGAISEEGDEPSNKSFRLPELSQFVKKKDKAKQLPGDNSKSKASKQAKPNKSSNGIGDHNGSANGNTSVTDNGTAITLTSPSDWYIGETDTKEEFDVRRKSGETNHVSTQV